MSLPDCHGYDAALAELEAIDPWDREYRRPSDFPTCRAFIAATSVAGPSPVTDTTRGGEPSPSPSRVVSPSLEGLPDE